MVSSRSGPLPPASTSRPCQSVPLCGRRHIDCRPPRAGPVAMAARGPCGLAGDSEEPDLTYLPSRLWLIGLGHLGQAYLWGLGILPYRHPKDLSLVLQDVDIITDSTESTSVLTHAELIGQKKTRAMAVWADGRGFETSIYERLFDADFKRQQSEPGVALCGLDTANYRRALDQVGFDMVIEAGLVLRFVRPWVSSEDIRKGTRWSDELWGRLRNTSYSIVCVTPEAVRSPWVNFEAGAVARAVGGHSHVSPLLLGMSAGDLRLGGVPLAMFQCTEFTRRDVERLVKAINAAAAAPMRQSHVSLRFRRGWASLRDEIGRIDIASADDSELEEALQDEAADAWLEEIEDKILELVAWAGDRQPLAVTDIAHAVSENHVVTQHYVDQLVRRRFPASTAEGGIPLHLLCDVTRPSLRCREPTGLTAYSPARGTLRLGQNGGGSRALCCWISPRLATPDGCTLQALTGDSVSDCHRLPT